MHSIILMKKSVFFVSAAISVSKQWSSAAYAFPIPLPTRVTTTGLPLGRDAVGWHTTTTMGVRHHEFTATLCNPNVKSIVSSSSSVGGVWRSRRNGITKESALFSKSVDDTSSSDGAAVADTSSRPDPSSLIAAKSPTTQRIAIAGITLFLLGGTVLFVQLLSAMAVLLPDGWFDAIRNYGLALPLSILFFVLGITHFTLRDMYVRIVPPRGTWGGLWNIPAPGADALGLSFAEYYTYLSGIAEMGGGLLLFGSATDLIDFLPVQIPAALLGLLTVAITPAAIYTFTHDVDMGNNIPRPSYPVGHLTRAVLQMALLALLWDLTFQ